MNPKIITVMDVDIVQDPEAVSEILEKACYGRRGRFAVTGVCQLGDEVFFVLQPRVDSSPREKYVLAVAKDTTSSGFSAELLNRWTHGFNAIGAITVADRSFILYARPETGA